MQHHKINQTIRLGTVEQYKKKMTIKVDVELNPTDKGVVLSMVGKVGNTWGGQVSSVIREFEMTNSITYANGVDSDTVNDLLDIWDAWHLNDMRAGCEHQTLLARHLYDQGLMYEDLKHIPAMKKCPFCGYEYGTAWKTQEIPGEVLVRLASILKTL